MRNPSVLLVLFFILCTFGGCELQGPPSSTTAAAAIEDVESSAESPVDDDETVAANTYRTSFLDQQEVIQIMKSPEFVHELNKNTQLYQMTSDEILSNSRPDEESTSAPRQRTYAEREMDTLYENALKMLNKSRSRAQGNQIMSEIALRGHEKAQAHVAWQRLLSKPIGQNVEMIQKMFELLASNGLPEAHMGLGFMYATGIGYNVSQAKAVLHYTIAALGDDPWAQMALGYRYWAGVAMPTSCEKALAYYKRVGTKVASQITFSGGTAVHRVRLLDEVENSGPSSGYLENDLVEYYQLLADKGDVQAQVGLGQLHYQGGRGIPLDHQKALQYFTPAANAGNAVAMAFLGKIYLEGSEYIDADNETALKYFTKAAELGNPVGQSGLGIMYLQGKGVPKDTSKAYNYFTQAAEQGWVDGQLQLGNMYFSGTGVKRDFKLANKYFNLASQSGHVLAYYNLGQMHALGLGMMRSCATAVELFKNVAERGKWSERLMMGHQEYKAYRFDDAFMQYALTSELGYEVGQSNAAFLLDRGETTLFSDRYEDLVRALQYWGRAAAQGYSAAQVKLGDYHYYGLGTTVDYDTAASHYRMASDQQHNAQAMFNLGYMHEQGLGMQQDWHLAKRCYDLAAETSADAKVPVALALMKLSLMFKMENIKDSPFRILLELDENIASNWDLYLITVLTLLLGLMIYLRRPPGPVDQPAAAPPPAPAAEGTPPPSPAAVPNVTPDTEPVAQPSSDSIVEQPTTDPVVVQPSAATPVPQPVNDEQVPLLGSNGESTPQ